MCAVYGNAIDVKGDQGKKCGSQKDRPNVRVNGSPFDGPSAVLHLLTQAELQELRAFDRFYEFHR